MLAIPIWRSSINSAVAAIWSIKEIESAVFAFTELAGSRPLAFKTNKNAGLAKETYSRLDVNDSMAVENIRKALSSIKLRTQ